MLRVTLGRAVRRLHRDTAFPRRRFAAYPALEADDWEGNAEHGAESVLDERRVSHKEASSSGAPTSQRWQEMQAALQQDSQKSRAGSARLPTKEEAQRELKSSGSCGSDTGTYNHSDTGTALTWKEALAAARMEDNQGSAVTSSPLTDTFGDLIKAPITNLQKTICRRHHTYLRISLTERCNLRCLYCMPEEGVELTPSTDLLTSEEILRLSALFVRAGITKIRLTGGEPTLRRDIVSLASQMNALPGLDKIGITTNGIALRRKLRDLLDNGVSLLNISLDTLRPDRFEQMTRRRGLERVLETIHAAVDHGFDPVKINVVVMRGVNDDEICDFVEMTRHSPINVRFIEYMPFDGNVWSHQKMVSYKDMLQAISRQYPQGLEPFRDPKGEVAKNFSLPGFRGSVSFITSMTKAFCSDCNRLRLMADGNLKVCLFGANEVSLRDAIREGASDEDLLAVISAAVNRKKAAHAGMFELSRSKNRAMVHIGG